MGVVKSMVVVVVVVESVLGVEGIKLEEDVVEEVEEVVVDVAS